MKTLLEYININNQTVDSYVYGTKEDWNYERIDLDNNSTILIIKYDIFKEPKLKKEYHDIQFKEDSSYQNFGEYLEHKRCSPENTALKLGRNFKYIIISKRPDKDCLNLDYFNEYFASPMINVKNTGSTHVTFYKNILFKDLIKKTDIEKYFKI